MSGIPWTQDELRRLVEAWESAPPETKVKDFARTYNEFACTKRSVEGIRKQLEQYKLDRSTLMARISPSIYPVYDHPLTMEGDALILPDMEIPFHHAEFVNHVLELAHAWKIVQCILAGDVLHMDALTSFSPHWKAQTNGNGIGEEFETQLMEFAKTLGSRQQGKLMEMIGNSGGGMTGDLSDELSTARKILHQLQISFDRIDFVIGNHEGRILAKLENVIAPDELLNLLKLDGGKWRIAPFYYSILISGGEKFQVEHPKNYGKFSATRLASKEGCHILMGHSHQLNFTFDASGKYYAIEMGCCVDETRLAYVAQRHNPTPRHKLGAVIVRGGYPWLLHEGSPWEELKKCAER